MPKIALVANIAWNLYNFRRALIEALQNAGFEVVLIAAADDYVERLTALNCRFLPLTQLSRKGTNPLKDFRLYREFCAIYRREQPDMILHYTIKPNIYGTLAAHKVGLQSLATVTGLGYTFLSTGLVSWLARRLYRYALKKATRVIFQNNDDLQLFVKEKLIGAEKTMLVRGSGIDTTAFAPRPKSISADKNTFIFLFVGRLLYDKGVREFLEAARAVAKVQPQCKFWLVGALDTENPSAINAAELASYADVVQYFGTSDAVADFIADADVVVLPSYREGLPRVMLEALSMARAVITTDAAGCRETVEDGKNGFMIPPQNTAALREAMLKMAALPPEKLAEMGNYGRQMAVDFFDKNVIIAQYLALIAANKKA
jgi:glycosyltransferase involved in cell wall biosynthesis